MDEFLDLERHAELAPEALVILAPGRPPLNYSSLWQRVVGMRRQLADAGVVSGRPLALVFPEGPDFLLTLLATTALGPCAPLDPAASQPEYEAYFGHLRAPVLITLEGCVTAIAAAEAQGMSVVRLRFHPQYELASVAYSPGRDIFPPRPLAAASLLMFTSSTSGGPKLVPRTPADLECSCRDEARMLELRNTDRVLNLTPQFSNRGLRASLTQLCQGGSVVCPPRFDPNAFPQWLEEYRPTWIAISATGLGALCSLTRQTPGLWRGTHIRFIRVGATASEPQLMSDLESLSGIPVLDGYGATEANGITRATPTHRKPGSVGRSIGPEIAIWDESGNPLEAGMAGEVVVRGPSVMSGYIDDDEATRRALVAGWFRTRDLGYLDEDGFLFLTGRLDEVINRGGQKVLPQEVEALLKDHPAVLEAAVFGIAHKTLGEEVAAAVILSSLPVLESELRGFVAERLAAYKVPRSILFLDRLPRNAAGKLQRKRLSKEYLRLTNAELQAEPPVTETEIALAAMWEEDLRQSPIGRDADFYRMGGDSLAATLVATRIQDSFGVSLDLRAFAEFPKLRDLSRVVDELRQGGRERLEELELASRNKPFPLSFAQERIWKYAILLPEDDGKASLNYNMAFVHLLRGPLHPKILRRGMIHLAERHEILRTTFERSGEKIVQVVHSAATCELPVLDVTHFPEPPREARLLLQAEACKPFYLARGPLVRFVLVRLGPEEHWLIRVNHHIISDGHSWKIYFSELGRVYDDLLYGRTPQPDPHQQDPQQVEYGDYALWQRREFSPTRPICQQTIEWWAARFSRLPSRRKSPLHESFNRTFSSKSLPRHPDAASQGVLTWGLDPAISSRLHQVQETDGLTFFDVRLAAFAALLAEITGRSEAIVGAHVSFRNRLEWRNTMGDFTNLVTLLPSYSATLSFRESARMVHQQVIETSTHGELPYEMLREQLQARGVVPPEIGVIFHSVDHTAPVRFGDAEMTWHDRSAPVMPWGFSMGMDKNNEDRLCQVLFNASLYQPEAMSSFVTRFARLLDAASCHPDHPMEQLLATSR